MDRVNLHYSVEGGVRGMKMTRESPRTRTRRNSSSQKVGALSPESFMHSRYRSESSSSISPSPTSMSTSEDEAVPDVYGDGQSVQPPAPADLPCLPLNWMIGLTLGSSKTDESAQEKEPVPLLKLLLKQ